MNLIKKIFISYRHFINFLYYINFSKVRNSYPYKLMGQKIQDDQSETVILYKIVGEENVREYLLKNVIANKEMIERFHPLDASKMGSIASDDILTSIPVKERRHKFELIKDLMLNSVHDIYSEKSNINKNQSFITTRISEISKNQNSSVSLCPIENSYIYKIVGVDEALDSNQTIIIFTIFGKREGYKLPAYKIVSNSHILTNFHPTEAAKLGFIFTGEKYLNSIEKSQRVSE